MSVSKTTLYTTIGASLEYYDFVIYAYLASYISVSFFPAGAPIVGLIQTFAVFALGYFARPVGGLIFGSLGDRIGRKRTFLITIALMASSTLAIGILPSYSQMGLAATGLLILLRLIQGLSLSGELAGGITLLSEHSQQGQRGWTCGLLYFGVSLGGVLASLLITLMTQLFSHQQMLTWGWRIPFIIGGLLGIVGFYFRRYTEESPLFLQQQKSGLSSAPIIELFKLYWRQLLTGFGLTLFPASLIMFCLFIPSYLHQQFGVPLNSVFLPLTIGLLWSAVCIPVFGRLSDRLGRSTLMLIGVVLICLGSGFLFALLRSPSALSILSFLLILQTITALLAACYPSMLAELFPTAHRFTGVAVCYNITFAVASLTPMIAARVIKFTGSPWSVIYVLMSTALLCLITLLIVPERTREQLA